MQSELHRSASLEASDIEDLANAYLRQIQDALKATAEVNDWTRDLQGSFEQFGGKVDV